MLREQWISSILCKYVAAFLMFPDQLDLYDSFSDLAFQKHFAKGTFCKYIHGKVPLKSIWLYWALSKHQVPSVWSLILGCITNASSPHPICLECQMHINCIDCIGQLFISSFIRLIKLPTDAYIKSLNVWLPLLAQNIQLHCLLHKWILFHVIQSLGILIHLEQVTSTGAPVTPFL